jgi:hypothetical protein
VEVYPRDVTLGVRLRDTFAVSFEKSGKAFQRFQCLELIWYLTGVAIFLDQDALSRCGKSQHLSREQARIPRLIRRLGNYFQQGRDILEPAMSPSCLYLRISENTTSRPR